MDNECIPHATHPYQFCLANMVGLVNGPQPSVNSIAFKYHLISEIENFIDYRHDGSMLLLGMYVYFKNEEDYLMVQLKFG